MGIREILKYPHDLLRQEAQRVERIDDEELQTLIDDMVETMRLAPGVGLAAPQVGVPLRVVVVEYGEEPSGEESYDEGPYGEQSQEPEGEQAVEKQLYVLINPEISRLSRAKEVAGEGCLSFPGIVADVARSLEATVVAQDREGQPIKIKASGWLARIFQHEIDHLNGVLFTDRAERVYTLEEDSGDEETAPTAPTASPQVSRLTAHPRMQLTRLSLTHFRNFARLDVQVPPSSVLIVGRNAQGKTSLLEAVYFLATLDSFHAETDRQLINFLEARNLLAVARLQASFVRSGREHQLEVRIIKEQTRNGVERSRKEVLLDGARKKAGEVIGQFQAVLFLPQMLQIIDGAPRHRRRYLDLALAQVQSQYGEQLSEYESVLTQRNALLRQLNENGGDASQLDFWEQRLALRGAQVLGARFRAIQEMEQYAARLHHELTRGAEVLRLNYQPSYDPLPAPAGQRTLLDAPTDRSGVSTEKIESGYLAALQKARGEDLARGTTSLGPHRDELRFLSNGVDLGNYGSRGQVRTTLLTLKLAELEWMHARSGHRPVLLLDEVLAELDEARRADLLGRLQADSHQVLLTTTDFNLFTPEFLDKAARWEIDEGRLQS